MTSERPNFHRLYAGFGTREQILIEKDEDRIWKYGAPGFVYMDRMNLGSELQLDPGSIVWDVACGTGEATCELQQDYPRLRFLAVNHHRLARPYDAQMTVPFITGLIEELDDKVKGKAEKLGLYPPQLILLSEGLHYTADNRTLDWALRAMFHVLSLYGKVLVYETEGKIFYPEYLDKIQELGLGFQVEELEGQGEYKKYLRLSKV